MWIKLTYNYRKDETLAKQKFAIEVSDANKALVVANDLSNVGHITGVKVMLEIPEDKETVVLNEQAITTRNEHLITNWDTQSFVWTLKAGITLGKK